MNFNDLVFKRRTVRRFTDEAISQVKLENIVSAGLAAPSPNNTIPWNIVVITNGEVIQNMKTAVENKLDKMFKISNNDEKQTLDKVKLFSTIFSNAPVVLAILSKDYKSPVSELVANMTEKPDIESLRRHPKLQATGALVENMLLAATEEGLGSCWISGALVAKEELENIIEADGMQLETLVAIGNIENQPHQKEPLDLNEFVRYIP